MTSQSFDLFMRECISPFADQLFLLIQIWLFWTAIYIFQRFSYYPSIMSKKMNSQDRRSINPQNAEQFSQLFAQNIKSEEQSLNQLILQFQSSTQNQSLLKEQIHISNCYKLNSKILRGTTITEAMRARLRSFLITETTRQRMFRQTCVLAQTLIDLYFLNKGPIETADFQNLALSCLIMASKLRDGRFPNINWETFSREQLLNFQKRIGKRLNYRLTPPTYNQFAQKTYLLWDEFIDKKHLYNFKFQDQPEGVNRKVRAFHQQLDCAFMVLKTLDYNVEMLTVNLFYINARILNVVQMLEIEQQSDEEFVGSFYQGNNPFRQFFQEFMHQNFTNEIRLDPVLGKYLKKFMVLKGSGQWQIARVSPIVTRIRQLDRLQTIPHNNYLLARQIIDTTNQQQRQR